MRSILDSRQWHLWVSLVLALPILVVAVTAVFIAHDKALGLKDLPVAAQWLPGYRAEARATGLEPRASLVSAAGEQFIGTNGGLYRLEAGRLAMVDGFAGVPVRALAEAPWGIVVAARNGVWVGRAGAWRRSHGGDAWNASLRADGVVTVALKEHGLLLSADGERWRADPQLMQALAAAAAEGGAEPITLGKLVLDLHTGKAFFGKAWEWIWIDLVGAAMALLALTGVYMWWRGERRKAALQRSAARGGVHAGSPSA